MEPVQRQGKDDAFWQRLVLPEEERRWIREWEGSYRWFRSPNVTGGKLGSAELPFFCCSLSSGFDHTCMEKPGRGDERDCYRHGSATDLPLG